MNKLVNALATAASKIGAGVMWLVNHEPVLTGTALVAAAEAVRTGIENGDPGKLVARAVAISVLGVVLRSKMTKPATVTEMHNDIAGLIRVGHQMQGERDSARDELNATLVRNQQLTSELTQANEWRQEAVEQARRALDERDEAHQAVDALTTRAVLAERTLEQYELDNRDDAKQPGNEAVPDPDAGG